MKSKTYTREAAQQVIDLSGQCQGVRVSDIPSGCHPVFMTLEEDGLDYLSVSPLTPDRECVVRVTPHELPPALCGVSFVIGCLMVEKNIFFPSSTFPYELERATTINPRLKGYDGLLQFYRDDALTFFS